MYLNYNMFAFDELRLYIQSSGNKNVLQLIRKVCVTQCIR